MIIELKRLKEDTVFLTKYIKINAINIVRSYDSYRIDLPDENDQINNDIESAGYEVNKDSLLITMGQFIDNLHKIYNE